MVNLLKSILLLLLCAPSLLAQSGDKKGEQQAPLPAHLKAPPAPPLPPEEALKTFRLADGFKIELVASEPMVQDPVALAFDPDGRLWVVEMRGYMPTIDGQGEDAEAGRITVLEDTDGDGRMDRNYVFLDKLVMPRAIALVRGGALVAASSKLWFAEDTDGDGKADKVTCVDPEFAGGRNPEHSANGLWPGMDNWLYNAKSQFRYRWLDGQWVKQRTESRGQWGITHDNHGRLFYNVNDSQLRGDVAPPSYMLRNANHKSASGINLTVATNQHVFPIRMNPGVNRGYRPDVLDAEGKLREFTAACSPVIYRGDNFPPEFQGNAFVCEPAGNLIKRNLVFDHGLELTSQFAYTNSEFLASTDERFRPVNAYNAPDGSLYIVDMYRGILQHRAYMTTHLRNQILARGLDQHINLGRLYRIVSTNKQPSIPQRLSRESSIRLVEYLSHVNGWCRDTAQRLLIERQDKSVVPGLVRLVKLGTNHLGRLHALWTLEGLNPDRIEDLLAALDDPHPKVQAAAVRVLELLAAGNPPRQKFILKRLQKLAATARPEVQFQIALSLGNFPQTDALPLMASLLATRADVGLMRAGALSGLQNRELQMLKLLLADRRWSERESKKGGAGDSLPRLLDDPPSETSNPVTAQVPSVLARNAPTPLPGESPGATGQRPVPPKTGRAALLHALASAVIKERNAEKIEVLLTLAGSQTAERDWRKKALLSGIVENTRDQQPEPIRFKAKPLVLAALAKTDDAVVREQVAKLKLLFAWPGHEPPQVVVRQAKPLTAEQKELFQLGKEQYLQICYGCHGVNGEGVVPVAPPLVNSSWVLGSEQRLTRIVLHGLEGPIHVNGTKYEAPLIVPAMPPLDMLDDERLAAILTYIRREWGHQASPVSPGKVTSIRQDSSERQKPWTESELLKIEPELPSW